LLWYGGPHNPPSDARAAHGRWPALTGAQLLAGHPESSFHAEVAAVVFGVLRVIGLRVPWRRPLLAFAGASLFGFALAAVAVVPFLECWRARPTSSSGRARRSPITRR
jgi:hypothetical protein